MKKTPLQRRTPVRTKGTLARKPMRVTPKKPATAQEKTHLAAVALLACVICGSKPVEVHHLRDGQGMGQRASHHDTLPLCHVHHRTGGLGVALHGGTAEFQRRFGTERELLAAVREYFSDPMAPYPCIAPGHHAVDEVA